MNEENNEENNLNGVANDKDNVNVIGALHKSEALPSLRTYQGDVAEFIKEKNESVTSIAVKEKEKRRVEEREESIKSGGKSEGFRISFIAIVLSLFLLFAGAVTVFFVVKFLSKEEPIISLKQEIIPYNNEVSLPNLARETFGEQLGLLSEAPGITAIRLSDTSGKSINTLPLFFSFLGANPPSSLSRSLKPEFFFGAMNNSGSISHFLIVSSDDFGIAFSGMLEWETTLAKDLYFLSNNYSDIENTQTDLEEEVLGDIWKDVIIKNKDTRSLFSGNKPIIAYTFLDKSTILITNNLESIGEISSSFASRSVIR